MFSAGQVRQSRVVLPSEVHYDTYQQESDATESYET
jgi:hypothetical protein